MSEIGDAIEHARRAFADREPTLDLQTLRAAATAAAAGPPRSLTEVLSADELTLIVEPKRATATRGTINPELDLAAVARECEAAGAAAISVVTEPLLSGGSLDDLRAARGAAALPLLARDFVVDSRQVYELRAAGADALLLAVRVYVDIDTDDDHDSVDAPSNTLAAIIRAAHQVGMEVVLSVCDERELEFALDTDADVLNIDNRANNGSIDVDRTFELLADVPVGWPVMSESIDAIDQVAKLHHAGVDGLLLDEGHLDTGLTSALAVYADLSLDA